MNILPRKKDDNTTVTTCNTVAAQNHLDRTQRHRSLPSALMSDRSAYFATQNENKRTNSKRLYDWKLYSPQGTNWTYIKFIRWLIVGGAQDSYQSHEKFLQDLSGLAQCLKLLREYLSTYGMPTKGGTVDQNYVLKEITRDLYKGGTPLWALESVMQRAAEGLTGDPHVNWCFLPRHAFIYQTGRGEAPVTSMFKIERGFIMNRLDAMEPIVVRLASFASNSSGAEVLPNTHFPTPDEFNLTSHRGLHSHPASGAGLATPHSSAASLHQQMMQVETAMKNNSKNDNVNDECSPTFFNIEHDKLELSKKILDIASETQGLFYYSNSSEYKDAMSSRNNDIIDQALWTVTNEERECFSRLACIEAMKAIEELDEKYSKQPELYGGWTIIFFRLASSACACAIWFNGSWQDMIVSGVLAVLVAYVGESSILSKQEKIIVETIASFLVGFVAGLVAIRFPNETCYSAMAISGVLDLLQGFRVVYAIVEIMSRNTVAGGADFLEGILFTGLIAYFLKFGQSAAAEVYDTSGLSELSSCTHRISRLWYFLLVPLASVSWSGLFLPNYNQLIPMAFHGVLGFCVNFGLSQTNVSSHLNNFISALSVTFSAGLFSRFTGRQAVGNTVAGLYALLPGAYLVRSFYSRSLNIEFFSDIILQAVTIGTGAWTGTLLCSPTLLSATQDTNSAESKSDDGNGRQRPQSINQSTMLCF